MSRGKKIEKDPFGVLGQMKFEKHILEAFGEVENPKELLEDVKSNLREFLIAEALISFETMKKIEEEKLFKEWGFEKFDDYFLLNFPKRLLPYYRKWRRGGESEERDLLLKWWESWAIKKLKAIARKKR